MKTIASNIRVTLTPGAQNPGPAVDSRAWATSDGGGVTRERENAWDGGGTYDILVGKATAEDLTLTRPYEYDKDDTWLDNLRREMLRGNPCTYNVAKQAYGVGDAAVGKAEVHANCPVVSVRTFQAAAGPEATATTVELVLATKGPAN